MEDRKHYPFMLAGERKLEEGRLNRRKDHRDKPRREETILTKVKSQRKVKKYNQIAEWTQLSGA